MADSVICEARKCEKEATREVWTPPSPDDVAYYCEEDAGKIVAISPGALVVYPIGSAPYEFIGIPPSARQPIVHHPGCDCSRCRTGVSSPAENETTYRMAQANGAGERVGEVEAYEAGRKAARWKQARKIEGSLAEHEEPHW